MANTCSRLTQFVEVLRFAALCTLFWNVPLQSAVKADRMTAHPPVIPEVLATFLAFVLDLSTAFVTCILPFQVGSMNGNIRDLLTCIALH